MRPTRARVPWTSLSAIVLLTVGCHTARLDMRAIEEPVMMNALPYPGSGFEATPVGDYRSNVGDASGVAATGPNQTTSKTMLENDAQAEAFELIGGFTDRALGGIEISASGGGANLLIAILGTADVGATGQAFEIQRETETGAIEEASASPGEEGEAGAIASDGEEEAR